MITRNASALVIVLLLAFSLALALGNIPLLALGLFAFFLSLLGLLVHTPFGVEVRRDITKTTLWMDEEATISWEISIERGLGPVFVYDPLPKEMELMSGSNYRVFWKGRGTARFTNAYAIRCPRRGSYELAPTRWEARHPLEFRQPQAGAAGEAIKLNILPRLLAARRIRDIRGLAARPYPVVDLGRMGVATTDFKEIREYVPGDPVRFINWKATARQPLNGHAKLLVNQFELEGKKAIWLFFDASSYMSVGTNLRSPLEHAIEAAGALGYYYLSRGYYLGAHFSSNPDEVLYPDSGKGQFHRLTRALMALSPQGQHYDLPRAVQLCRAHLFRYSPRCIIITRLDAEAGVYGQTSLPEETSGLYQNLLYGIEGLANLAARGHRRLSVWVVAVNGYYYADPAVALPKSPQPPFAKGGLHPHPFGSAQDRPNLPPQVGRGMGPSPIGREKEIPPFGKGGQGGFPATKRGDRGGMEMATALRALETRPTVHALREKGVSVLEWNPFAEQFAQALLRQLRLEGKRE